MLISPEVGTTFCISNDILYDIMKHDYSDDLKLLLVQRGFAKYQNSRKISCRSDKIKPEFFLIDMTKQCNLNCKYCFREDVGGEHHISEKMLEQICRELISYWKKNPSYHLSIQPWGGEPLLEFPLIVKIRQLFDEAGLFPEIVIETNATLITPCIAKALYENKIKVGISIDGCENIQNDQRPYMNGGDSFADVKKGIINLRDAGFENFGTITVVTQNTVSHIEEIFRCFTEELGLTSIKFNIMRRNSRNFGLAVSRDSIGDYTDALIAQMKKLYKKKVHLIEQNISQRMINLLYRPNNNICNSCGCHGGFRMLSVSMDGKLYPCELTDYEEFCIGTIGSGDIAEMVENSIASGNCYFEKRDLEKCSDCPWKYYCRGGCRSAVKYEKGTTAFIDETECAFNRAIYPRLAEIILTDPEFAGYLKDGRL